MEPLQIPQLTLLLYASGGLPCPLYHRLVRNKGNIRTGEDENNESETRISIK